MQAWPAQVPDNQRLRLEVVLVVVSVIEVFVGIVPALFVVAVNLGHLSRFFAVPDIFENFLKTGLISKLFLLSFVLDIGDAIGVGSAGEGVINIIHIYKVAV